jgi:hypothetical protein
MSASVEADRLCTPNRGDRRCCEPQATGQDNKTRAILLHSLAIDRTVFITLNFDESSVARHGGLTGVSGQRPEQGADATFLRSTRRGHKALTLHSEVLSLSRCW